MKHFHLAFPSFCLFSSYIFLSLPLLLSLPHKFTLKDTLLSFTQDSHIFLPFNMIILFLTLLFLGNPLASSCGNIWFLSMPKRTGSLNKLSLKIRMKIQEVCEFLQSEKFKLFYYTPNQFLHESPPLTLRKPWKISTCVCCNKSPTCNYHSSSQ